MIYIHEIRGGVSGITGQILWTCGNTYGDQVTRQSLVPDKISHHLVPYYRYPICWQYCKVIPMLMTIYGQN